MGNFPFDVLFLWVLVKLQKNVFFFLRFSKHLLIGGGLC